MLALRIEADRARAVAEESHHTVMDSTRDVRSSISAPPLPQFHESEGNIDVYIERFERYAANEGWEYGCYTIYLSALLDGPALDIYHRMPLEDANDYKALKEASLKRYPFTAQDFRKRFFNRLACAQCASRTEAPSNGLRKYHRRERQWHDGTTGHDGTTARRHDGTTARRHDGTTARRHDGTTARRHDGTTHSHMDFLNLIIDTVLDSDSGNVYS